MSKAKQLNEKLKGKLNENAYFNHEVQLNKNRVGKPYINPDKGSSDYGEEVKEFTVLKADSDVVVFSQDLGDTVVFHVHQENMLYDTIFSVKKSIIKKVL